MQTNNESLKLEGKKRKEINSKNLLTGKRGNLTNIKMLGENHIIQDFAKFMI